MTPYDNGITNAKGIMAFKIGDDFIILKFRGFLGLIYTHTYTYISAGKETVESMKRRALSSHGLNSFLTQYEPKFKINASFFNRFNRSYKRLKVN